MAIIKINERQAALLKSINENPSKIYKITKEQYSRIFGKVVTESQIANNRVDKSFKTAFSGADVKNISEDDFNIKKPNTDIPRLDKAVMNRPVQEDLNIPEFHHLVSKVITDIYTNPSQAGLDRFWVSHGITWGDIISYLTSVGLIISSAKGYQLAKRIGNKILNPKDSIKAIESSLETLVTKASTNQLKDPAGQQLMTSTPDIDEESNSINAIWPNNPDDERDAPEFKGKKLYSAVAMNNEIAILKDAAGHLQVFYYDEINPDDFGSAKIDLEAITYFVNHHINDLSVGVGIADFEKGVNLVKIDEPLKQELLALYDKNPHIQHVLSNQLSEMTSAGSAATGGSSGPFVAPMGSKIIKKEIPVVAEGLINEFNFKQAHELHTKYDKNYDGRFNVDETEDVVTEGPVAGMTSTGGSSGPYDANALPNISRDGTFKKVKKKSRAEVDTQWPHGKFVKKDGAGDSIDTIKQKKGKGSVISKDALLEVVKEEVINELGVNDWKMVALFNHLSKASNEEYARCFAIITHREISKVKDPKNIVAQTLREMGKEDIDDIYNQIFDKEIKSPVNGF